MEIRSSKVGAREIRSSEAAHAEISPWKVRVPQVGPVQLDIRSVNYYVTPGDRRHRRTDVVGSHARSSVFGRRPGCVGLHEGGEQHAGVSSQDITDKGIGCNLLQRVK